MALDNSGWTALLRLGGALARTPLHRYLFGTAEGRQLASILVVAFMIVSIWTASVLYRRSSWKGMQEMYANPRAMLGWYGPWNGPLFTLGIALLVIIVFPVYLPRMDRFRPQEWPDLLILAPRWAYPSMVIAVVLGATALLVGIRRSFREGIIESSEGKGGWASRSEIIVSSQPRIVMPFLVSYRGTVKDWTQGIQPPPSSSRFEAIFRENVQRFLPSVNVAGLAPISPSDQTLWEHILITGHTGSGKGMGLFTPIMYSALVSKRPIPFCYQDFKAETPLHNRLWEVTGLEPIRFGRAARGGWPSMRWSPLTEALQSEAPALAVADLLAILAPNEGPGDFVSPPTRTFLAT